MSHRSVWAALTIRSALVESVNSMYSFRCDLFEEKNSSLLFLARMPVCFTVCDNNDDEDDDGDGDNVQFYIDHVSIDRILDVLKAVNQKVNSIGVAGHTVKIHAVQ